MGSGNEIGPFRAIEESALAHLSTPSTRSDLFAWYTLTSSAGAATGTLVCGWVTEHLQSTGWDIIAAYRVIFFAYAAVGLVKLVLVCLMSKKVEATKQPPPPARDTEEEPLLRAERATVPPVENSWFLPNVSKKTSALAIQLCLVFAVDNLASGLAPVTWVTYFFYRKFGLKEGELGTLFAVGFVLSALSVLVASSIAKRFGNVKVGSLATAHP